MAEPTQEPITPPAALSDIAEAIVGKVLEPAMASKAATVLRQAIVEAIKDVLGIVLYVAAEGGVTVAKGIVEAEQVAKQPLGELAAVAIQDIFGIEASGAALSTGSHSGGKDEVGKRIGEMLFRAFSGEADLFKGREIFPTDETAKTFISTMSQLALKEWMQGWMVELASVGQVETFSHLGDILAHTMGLGPAASSVHTPLIQTFITTPLRWKLNREHRPNLLSESAAIEAYLRGDFDETGFREEMARQGLSERRINMMIDNARKRLSFADLLYRNYAGELSNEGVISEARALGYDEPTARLLLAIEDHRRIDRSNGPVVTEAVAAFQRGEISESEMASWVRGASPNVTEAERTISTAKARRAIGFRRLPSSQVRALVLNKILTVADYRRALQREQWALEDALALELDLRDELQDRADVEAARKQQDAERQAEKAAAAAKRAARDAEIAEKKARAQFPALAEYRRAYVHGLIGRDVLAEALTRDGIVQDQGLYLGDADEDRAEFIAAAEAADKRRRIAEAGGLSIAQLEQGVLAGVLTIEAFDADLARRELPADDRRVLVQLLQVEIDKRRDAEAKRKEADERARIRGVSNADWQRAVRLGVRTMDQYAAFLDAIETPDLAKSLLLDVLAREVAADEAAAALRAKRDAEAARKGIALNERRRAVIAGVRPFEWYADVIATLGWAVDDQLADLDLLRLEMANAEAARRKRSEIEARDAKRRAAAEESIRQQAEPAAAARRAPTLTLAQLESAFKLGLLTADEFADALVARDFSDADADMIVQLALLTLPNVRAGAVEREKVKAAQTGRDAPLAVLEHAVRRGLRTLADYEDEISRRGFSADAAALLSENMAEQLTIDIDALRLKIAAAMAKGSADYTLDELLAAFENDEIDAAQLRDAIIDAGAPADAALVFSRLVGTFGVGV